MLATIHDDVDGTLDRLDDIVTELQHARDKALELDKRLRSVEEELDSIDVEDDPDALDDTLKGIMRDIADIRSDLF